MAKLCQHGTQDRSFSSTWGWHALTFALAWVASASSWAQFDAAKVKAEPSVVASRYTDPTTTYSSPGFAPGRSDFASHDEVLAYLRSLAAQHPQMALTAIGKSQQGRDIPLVVLSSKQGVHNDKPTVLLVGQQHGNEPAGGEAALALIAQLLGPERELLAHVNVVILPRANPDGAEKFARATANGLDLNRDHLLLQTPEGQAMATVALRYGPQVAMDLHEFTVGDRWLDKFGGYAKYDALLQAATVGDMDPDLAALALRDYLGAARAALEANQLTTFWYHTSSNDPGDRVVSMGGVQPDTGRNVFGLRHAVSILIETRGVGLGRAHFARRVHSHVLASLAVIRTAASQGQALVNAVAAAGVATAAKACKGEMVVRAQTSPGKEPLEFVDAKTGLDRTERVDWRSALALKVVVSRARPCGYWLGSGQASAARTLEALGVKVTPLAQDRRATVEAYRVLTEKGGQRLDARGAIAASTAIREVSVALDKAPVTLPGGGWFVDLNQPLGSLISAALEPDSQNSFVANHLMQLDANALLRVFAFESTP
jgi:Zinc carboxypeptidase